MEMMDYQQCLAYVVEKKLNTYHQSQGGGSWVVARGTDGTLQIVELPTFKGAVSSWKARFDVQDRQGEE